MHNKMRWLIAAISALLIAMFALNGLADGLLGGFMMEDDYSSAYSWEDYDEPDPTVRPTHTPKHKHTPQPTHKPKHTPQPTHKPKHTQQPQHTAHPDVLPARGESAIDEYGEYTSAEEVAAYIATFDHLPSNFITKNEARKHGWNGGSLEPYTPGKSIGGDHFGNYEGVLPERKGLNYTECDIDTKGARSRGAKRIVFDNEGRIYYTDDHYETFTLIYGEESP